MTSLSNSGRTSGQMTEKSMFSQTCNLLRDYLKEKGPLGELNLGMARSLEGNVIPTAATTANLFPASERSVRTMGMPRNMKSMDLFPQQAGFGSSVSKESVPKMADYSINKLSTTAKEPEKAQMTIFYGGQVIVFNDFPAEKVQEIMHLASMGSSESSTDSTTAMIPSGSSGGASKLNNNLVQERHHQPPPSRPAVCDLPIARKASLTRFLEKRKDRIVSKAPYSVGNNPMAGPPKPAERKSWLGLAAQSAKQV